MELYDTIIVGGGIAGLYTAHLLQKRDPKHTFIILEKEKYLGGRLLTYSDKYMTVEKGGARFSENHHLLLDLLKEMGLDKKVVEASPDAFYSPADGTPILYDSVFDFDDRPINPFTKLFDVFTEAYVNSPTPIAPLLVRVILASKLETKANLISQTFTDFAKEVLSTNEIQHIHDAFGYSTELVEMNAYDCLALLENGLNPRQKFYVLAGGLTQLINKMVSTINMGERRIFTGSQVLSATYDQNHFVIRTKTRTYRSINCIFAVPKQGLEKLALFKPIYKELNYIGCFPLCRIYCKFDMTNRENAWIRNLPKITTNNNLRIIIPIDSKSGVIMASYTDHKYADFWLGIYESEGVKGVNKELVKLYKETLGIDIPLPISTKVFHWGCGVGYWGKGADSAALEKLFLQPFANTPLYICGEHYSAKSQQLIEGALETAEKVVEKLRTKP
jgi:monoamine oxidase